MGLFKDRKPKKGNWGEFVTEAVKAYQAAREAKLDAVLTEPFDHKAHSTRIVKGTKVAYSVQFLRSIGCSPIDPMCHARGVVYSIRELSPEVRLATIKWKGKNRKDFPEKVNVCNLARVGPNMKFCAC